MRRSALRKDQALQNASANLTKSNALPTAPSRVAHPLLHLQRTIGNQAVLQMLVASADGPNTEVYSKTGAAIQPKLTVNAPGDIYEQEADQIAEQVMRMPESQSLSGCDCGSGCAKCQSNGREGGHEALQTKHVGSSGAAQMAAPPGVDEVLASPGQPLAASARAFFEPRFARDFSDVRVHADAHAAQSAEAVAARAYTVGSDVVLNTGGGAPASSDEMRLLAHELAHVVQQDSNHAAGGALQRKVDNTGKIKLVRFTIGTEIGFVFAHTAWRHTVAGPLQDKDLPLLRALALKTGESIDDDERMFMAALLDPINARKLHAEHPSAFVDEGAEIEFAASSITPSNQRRVRDFGRAENIQAPGPRTEPNTEAGHIAALDRDMIAMAGPFAPTAQHALKLADSAGVTHLQVYYAMLNGASDSTPGDRAFAGAAYVMARIANIPVSYEVITGRLKVDEVDPSALHKRFNADYMPEAGGGRKGDTISLPTNFDLSKLDHQGTLVHELTHAAADKAATSLIEVPKVESEMEAYRREARFYLDTIAPLTDPARAQAVKQVGDAVTSVQILCMALEALAYPVHETATIEGIIHDVNAVAFPLSRADVITALKDSRADLEKKIVKAIVAADKTTAKKAVTQRAGFVGESVLDSPSK